MLNIYKYIILPYKYKKDSFEAYLINRDDIKLVDIHGISALELSRNSLCCNIDSSVRETLFHHFQFIKVSQSNPKEIQNMLQNKLSLDIEFPMFLTMCKPVNKVKDDGILIRYRFNDKYYIFNQSMEYFVTNDKNYMKIGTVNPSVLFSLYNCIDIPSLIVKLRVDVPYRKHITELLFKPDLDIIMTIKQFIEAEVLNYPLRKFDIVDLVENFEFLLALLSSCMLEVRAGELYKINFNEETRLKAQNLNILLKDERKFGDSLDHKNLLNKFFSGVTNRK